MGRNSFEPVDVVSRNLKILHLALKLFGSHPFNSSYSPTLFGIGASIISTVFNAFSTFYIFYATSNAKENLFRYLIIVKYTLALSGAFFISLKTYRENEKIKNLIFSLNHLHSLMISKGFKVNINVKKKIFYFNIFIFLFLFCYDSYSYSAFKSFIVLAFFLTNSYNNLIMQFFVIKFLIMVKIMESFFKTLTIEVCKNKRYDSQVLNDMLSFYYKLLSLCRMCNDIFTSQLLFYVTVVFIEATINMYNAIIYFKIGRTDDSWSRSFWVVARIIHIWSIIHICNSIKTQAENFNITLRFWMSYLKVKNDPFLDLLRIHFTIKSNIEFDANGFFKIDFPLLHSMGAGVTSYLVYLIQSDSY